MKKAQTRRSDCPINFSLEMVGDSWSLLIIRDIVYFGKKTYGEFVTSRESIARNILADRLLKLEQKGVLIKNPHPKDGRKDVYQLTEKGLALIPLLLDMADWGFTYDKQTDAPASWIQLVRTNREEMLKLIYQAVRNGDAIFVGENNVISKLKDNKLN